MATTIDIDPLELSALLASRVIHDLTSPIASIGNALELMEADAKPDMQQLAMDLIRQTGHEAGVKLKFVRVAFGASGSVGSEFDTVELGRVATDFVATTKAKLDWKVRAPMLPKLWAKLVMNLVLLGANSAARNGLVEVAADRDGDRVVTRVVATADRARIQPETLLLVTEGRLEGRIDGTRIQPYYTWLLAREAGAQVAVAEETGRVTFVAQSKAASADAARA